MINTNKAANANPLARNVSKEDYFELAGHYQNLVLDVQQFVKRNVQPSADAVMFLRRFEENVEAASKAIHAHV